MRNQRCLKLIRLIAAFMLAGCQPETGSEPDSRRDVTRSNTSAIAESGIGLQADETAAESIAPNIKFKNGKLSVSLKDLPLHQLATEVAERSGVSVQLLGKFPDSSITADFTDYPLEIGLRRLLSDLSTIFVYANIDESRDDGRQLVGIMVLPQNGNTEVAIGIRTVDEMVADLSEHLQPFAPRSDHVPDIYYPEIDPAIEQALFELGEYLTNNISDATKK